MLHDSVWCVACPGVLCSSFFFFFERSAVSAGLLDVLLSLSGDGSPHSGLLVLTAKCSAVALDGIERFGLFRLFTCLIFGVVHGLFLRLRG